MTSLTSNCIEADRSFGPTVPSSCRGGFDFTLLFEEICLTLLPSISLLLAVIIRLWQLQRVKAFDKWTLLHASKLCTSLSFIVVEIVILILWTTSTTYRTRLSIASAVVRFVTAVAICSLSHYEQTRTLRPSPVINFYLLFSAFFDAVQVRTFWLADANGIRRVAITSSVAIGLKFALLILEAIPKPTFVISRVPPEEVAGIYSLRTFWWLNKLFRQGYSRSLHQNDLYGIHNQLKASYCGPCIIAKWYSADPKSKNALLFSLLTALQWQLLVPVPARLALIAFTFSQPFLIHRAIDFIGQTTTGDSPNIGYGLIGATFLVYSGLALTNGYYNHKIYRGITAVRSALLDIIYHKTLTLDLSTASKAAPLGLVGADVERIALTLEKVHELWSCTIEIGLAVFLLERQIGWPCLGPIVLALLCTGANTYIAKAIPSRLKIWNQSIQKRVAITSSMLSNMKAVKMMGVSQLVSERLQDARTQELEASAKFRLWVACMNTVALIPKQLSAPLVFMIFAVAVQFQSDGGLTAARAFTTLSIIELLTTPLGKVLQSLPSITASSACFGRIQEYLNSLDILDNRTSTGLAVAQHSLMLGEKRFETQVTESELHQDSYLDQVSPVVAFKDATLSYNTTSPSILDAITFEIQRASLTMIVGPVGSGKSTLLKAILGELRSQSGQVSVSAGSVSYCDQTPWIPNGIVRDTILGGLDMDQPWFDEVIKACALEKDIEALQGGLNTSVGSRGIALSEGQKQRVALCRAVYSRASLMVLDDILRSLDSKTEADVTHRLFSPSGLLKRHGMTTVIATHSVRHLPLADRIVVLGVGGNVQQIGTFAELSHCDGYVHDLALLKTAKAEPEIEKSTQTLRKPPPVNLNARAEGKGNMSDSGTKDVGTYRFYSFSIGWWRIFILLSAAVLLAFGTKFPQIWMQWWAEAHGSRSAMYIGVYFLLAGGRVLVTHFCSVSASGLHEQLLKAVIHAPLSFFTNVDAGVVLNRFSQDMGYINSQLPISLYQAIFTALLCLMQIALIAYGSKYLAIFIPVTLAVVWFLQRYYLSTSRQLRLLDLELKSPVYTALTETLEGLVTIRAFGLQSTFQSNFRTKVDSSQRAVYLLYMIQRWLNFVLDCIVAALAVLLMTFATQFRNSSSAASLGVGLVSVIGFSQNLSQFVFFYTELETFLGAVARIKEWVDSIKPEDVGTEGGTPPKDWPADGNIEFEDVTAAYNSQDNPALNNISFSIKAGQKVCIVGRTGSGKSTLMSALLRLIDLQSGTTYIDGIDISTLPAETVRRNVTAIPQTPFFLPGSIASNLTLSVNNKINGLACIAALQKVGLWDLIFAQGGLEANISALSLSHGQQQLFCLARAILKKTTPGASKILIMDETTSGVDGETEELMERLLFDEFMDSTVICIAHRLKLARNCDVVVVLEGGSVVEMGEPEKLLEESGRFQGLWEAQLS